MISSYKTQKEIQQVLNLKLFTLEKEQKVKDFKIQDVGDSLPVGLLINHRDGQNLYMNKISEELLNYTREEINNLGQSYPEAISFDPSEIKILKKLIINYYEREDNTEVLSFFQRVRPQGFEQFKWMYITSKLLREDPNETPDKRIVIACPVDLMGNMSSKINKALDDNLFMKKNLMKFAQLTKREKQIITLVAQGYSNPDISEILFISRHTVEKHRKNIKYKVETKSTAELIRFAIAFDLVD